MFINIMLSIIKITILYIINLNISNYKFNIGYYMTKRNLLIQLVN